MIAHSQRPYSWINPKLEVRETGKHGRGVFAGQPIKMGTILAVFSGYVITVKEEAVLPPEISDTGIQIAEDLVLTQRIQT